MADTLAQMTGRLLAYVPTLPHPLAELWLRDRWRQVCETRHWSFLRAAGIITTPVAYSTGTVSVTNGSTTVSLSGGTWTAGMVNRQLKVGSQAPVFNITAVAGGGDSLTIDQAWPKADASGQAYQIVQAWVTMPTDFLMFKSVVDPTGQWRLNFNLFDQQHLDTVDPQRTSTSLPYALVSLRDYVNPTTGVESARYELWPHATTLRHYPYTYIKRTPDLGTSTVIPRIVTGDVIILGAMADLCRWPGPSKDERNPMFNLQLAMDYERRFLTRVAEAGRQDNEIYQTDLNYGSLPLYPGSAEFAQSHGMYEPGGDLW